MAHERRRIPGRRSNDRRSSGIAGHWRFPRRAATGIVALLASGLVLAIGWSVFETWQRQCCSPTAAAATELVAPTPVPMPLPAPESPPQFDCRRLVDGIQVMFAPASAVLAEADKRQLDQVVDRCLKGGHIEVGGHTDSDGTALANQRISVARASAVVDYLISRGIPANTLAAIGYGAMRPVADNATEAGKAQNRRITFVRR